MLKNSLIIFPSYQSKNEVCDFLQQTARILSVRGNHVYIVDYTTEISIKEILITFFTGKRTPVFSTYLNGLKYLTPIYILPFRKNDFIKKTNMFLYFFFLQIKLFATHFHSSKKIIWMFFPQLSFLVKNTFFSWKILYDIVDTYTYSPEMGGSKKLKTDKKYLLQKSDKVFAISETLKNEFETLTHKKISLVPQGFDLRSFSQQKKSSKITPPNNKPCIGFVGQINQRLDTNLLFSLISQNPQWNFVFVGPKNFNTDIEIKNKKEVIQKIFKQPNFFWFDTQPKNTIPSLIKKFDVTTIPYDISIEFNKLSYPMKLFEYFYLKKPVITTPILELTHPKFSHLLTVGKNAKEWEKSIRNILKQKKISSNQEEQKRLAQENSWEEKIKAISQECLSL